MNCRLCRAYARSYASAATALAAKPLPATTSTAASDFEADLLQAAQQRGKPRTMPVLTDLLALRPKEFDRLRPPPSTNRKPHLKIEWYEQQHAKAVQRVESAFTLAQLKKLRGFLLRSTGAKADMPKSKSALATFVVAHPDGWDWPEPDVVRERAGLTQEPEDLGPQSTEVMTVSHRELYLMYQTITSQAAPLKVRLDISTPRVASSTAPIEIKLFGPQSAVDQMQKTIKNATKQIGCTEFTIPEDVTLEAGIIQAIALQSSTYLEQSPASLNKLLIWRYDKKSDQSSEALDLLHAACAKARAETQRPHFALAPPAEAVDLGYHLFPTYLSKPPSVVSSPTGAGGLFGRISRVLSDYDRADQGLVARPAVVFPVMHTEATLAESLLAPLEGLEGSLHLLALVGQLVVPLPTVDPHKLPDPGPFASLARAVLASTRPAFIPSLPPSFLSFESTLAETYSFGAYDHESRALRARMAKYAFEGRAERRLTYAPLVPSRRGVAERIEGSMAVGFDKDPSFTFSCVVMSEVALFRPDQANDILLVAERRVDLPDLATQIIEGDPTQQSKLASKSRIAKEIEVDGTAFHLISNRHSRTSDIRTAIAEALPSASGGLWQMVKSYYTLPVGQQSSRLQLCLGDVPDAHKSVADVLDAMQRL